MLISLRIRKNKCWPELAQNSAPLWPLVPTPHNPNLTFLCKNIPLQEHPCLTPDRKAEGGEQCSCPRFCAPGGEGLKKVKG